MRRAAKFQRVYSDTDDDDFAEPIKILFFAGPEAALTGSPVIESPNERNQSFAIWWIIRKLFVVPAVKSCLVLISATFLWGMGGIELIAAAAACGGCFVATEWQLQRAR
jgi:hypothetical protein